MSLNDNFFPARRSVVQLHHLLRKIGILSGTKGFAGTFTHRHLWVEPEVRLAWFGPHSSCGEAAVVDNVPVRENRDDSSGTTEG